MSTSATASATAECLFCKIRDGQIPATITYRDERVLAFKDIGPKAPLHQLVVPLEHIGSLTEVGPAQEGLLGHLILSATRIANEACYEKKGFRVVMNTGPEGGQSVFHIHLHVLAGRPLAWPPG
jgi:histidine triad (HIT) family protein